MKISYYHASKHGNGAAIAEEFKRQMGEREVRVNVSHVKNAEPKALPLADLYVFSSPGRFGKPIGDMRKFLKKAVLPPGARYALIATEYRPDTAKRTEPAEDGGKCQRVLPIMHETLQIKGANMVMETKIYVTGLKGPLETGWEEKVQDAVEFLAGGSAIVREEPAAAPVFSMATRL